MSKLDGSDDIGNYLVKLISNKTVAQNEVPPANGPDSIEANGNPEASPGSNPEDDTISIEKS